jgi:HK97 family phage portal protein
MPSLIGQALGLRNAGPPVPMSGSGFRGFSGVSMIQSGSETYMQAYASSGTVWQIVHLLASSVAKPEWRLYRKAAQDGRVRYTTSDQGSDQRTEVVKHQALKVLQQPATIRAGGVNIPVWTRFGLFELGQTYLELTGEAPLVVDRDPRSSIPLGLWPVRPDRLEPVPDPDTYLKGWLYTAPDGREKIPLDVTDVIQVKYPNPMDPYRGLGPAQAVLVDIEAARYSAEWNRNYFLNSAEPGGVIQVDHAMGDDEWDQLTERWRETHRGVARAHRVAVLEAGAVWVPNQHSLRDMDFGNLRNVSRDLIREAWGIHKIMLGNSDDVNRANAQTGEEVFANWSVVPRLDRWKDALNQQFLPLFGSTGEGVEFDYIYPLPANREQDNAELTTKADAWAKLVGAGADPHDAAEVAGLPDMKVVEQAVQAPALPPGWVPEPSGGDSGGTGDSDGPAMAARLRKMLGNGHQDVPLEALRTMAGRQ